MQRLSTAPRHDPPPPVTIESRALGTLAFIRASIEASGAMVVPGMASIVMGLIGLAAAAAALYWPARWLQIWILAGVVAFSLGGAIVTRQAAGRVLLVGPLRKFLLCLCPVLGAAGLVSYVLWRAGLEDLLPGLWLLLYGCAVASASTVMAAGVGRMAAATGALFWLLGAATLELDPSWRAYCLGAGFGGLHLLYGLLSRRIGHGE